MLALIALKLALLLNVRSPVLKIAKCMAGVNGLAVTVNVDGALNNENVQSKLILTLVVLLAHALKMFVLATLDLAVKIAD